MNAMKTEQVRRAALAVGVGGTLVAGVLLFVSDADGKPAPGLEARAMAAAGPGAPAALPDLRATNQGLRSALFSYHRGGRSSGRWR